MKTRFYFCYLTALTSAAIGLAVCLPSASNMAQETVGSPIGGDLPGLPSVESADADPARRELQDATVARDRSRNDDAVQSSNRDGQQEADMRDPEMRYRSQFMEYSNQAEKYRQPDPNSGEEPFSFNRRFQDDRERFPGNFGPDQFGTRNKVNGPSNGPPITPEMEKIQFQLLRLQQDLKKAESDEQKAKLNEEIKTQMAELKSELDAQYDLYLEQHETPLKELEARLEKLRTEFEWRKTAKEGLVKLRLETIFYESQGLGWPGGHPNQPDGLYFDGNGEPPSLPQGTRRPSTGVNPPREYRNNTMRRDDRNQADSPPSRPDATDGGR